MIDPLHDPQRPESWSADALGYDTAFAAFTSAFAVDAVRLLEISPADHVLDIAAGTGSFALAAAASGARVLATDFSPGMVEVLRERARTLGVTTLTTEVMDGQALALDDQVFDAACSMFGVMFFPDLDAGLREFIRVTRAGGRMAVGVWDIDSYRLPELLGRAARAAVPEIEFGMPPPRSPRLGNPEMLARTLGESGWDEVAVHSVEHPLVLDDPAAFMLSIPRWSAPLRPVFDQIPTDALPTMASAFAEYAAEVSADANDVRIPWRAHIGTGIAP